MMLYLFRAVLLTLAGLIAMTCCLARATPPHIVFILADDLTFRDLGCYGSPNVATPHIDRIAAEGLRFDQCFQATAMCSPTRHNLYTGLYPVKSGAYPQTTWANPGVQSIAHFLRPLGYRVALTGKRHVLPIASFPFEYLDDDTDPDLAAVEAYLKRDLAQPSCVFLCFREPHTPWTKGDHGAIDPTKLELPPNFVDTPETRRQLSAYYAEVGHLDNSVGQVMEMLDHLGIANNTLLIFASEQGNAFPFAKWTCYGNGLQSALIARWPGVTTPGSVTDAMVEYVDVAPTLIDIAGGPPRDHLDGRSFLPALRGDTNQHKEVVYAIQTTRGITNGSQHYGIRSARNARYRYIMNLTPEIAFANNITNEKGKWSTYWKTWVQSATTDEHAHFLVDRYQHRAVEELYDTRADPYELNNLADEADLQAVKRELHSQLLAWMESQGDRGQATEMIADQRSLKTADGLRALRAHPDLSENEHQALLTAKGKE